MVRSLPSSTSPCVAFQPSVENIESGLLVSCAPLVLTMMRGPLVPPMDPRGVMPEKELRATVWRSTLGSTRDQAPFPIWLSLGAPNLGGSLVTAGGVVFIAATTDKFFRGFDAKTGEEIWSQRIPFTGSASPMTYRLKKDGKQFLVLAAGGHGWSEPGDAVIAYALP